MGPPLTLGLRAKVALLAALVMLFVMGAMSAAGAYFFSRQYADALESRSLAIAKSVTVQLDRLLQFGIELENLVGFEEQCADAVKTYRGVEQAMVLGRDGMVLFHSDVTRIGQPVGDRALVDAMQLGTESIARGKQSMAGKVSAVVPVMTRAGEQVGAVVVAFPDTLIGDQMREMWRREIGVGIAFLAAGVVILLLVLTAFVTRPVARLIHAVERMEGQPLVEAAPAPVESNDELGQLASSFNSMLDGLKQTTVSKRELEQRNAEISLLSEMNQTLLTALTLEEAYRLLPRYGRRLFATSDGSLFLFISSRNRLDAKANWGAAPAPASMTPQDCWAVRRGQPHAVNDAAAGLLCPHVERSDVAGCPYVCVPLSAQGEMIGLLHLAFPAGHEITPDEQRLAGMLAEQLSFALGNLRLREALREQSIRDPLTGLFNRRYLEETLDRELARTQRKSLPLAVVMVDVDNFKRINDTLGHDAGDAVLHALAREMLENVRGSDIVCRHGGEEFVLLLPEATLEIAVTRAEALREAVGRMEVTREGEPAGRVTISAGVAAYPQHGATGTALIAKADEALYQAKRTGRNRVVSPPS